MNPALMRRRPFALGVKRPAPARFALVMPGATPLFEVSDPPFTADRHRRRRSIGEKRSIDQKTRGPRAPDRVATKAVG